jgi:hypothetical protein
VHPTTNGPAVSRKVSPTARHGLCSGLSPLALITRPAIACRADAKLPLLSGFTSTTPSSLAKPSAAARVSFAHYNRHSRLDTKGALHLFLNIPFPHGLRLL